MRTLSLKNKETLTGLAYAALPLAGFSLFYIIPFGNMLWRTVSRGGIFVGFAQYTAVLQSDAFRLAAWNTFRFIGLGLPMLLLLALCTALLLNTRLKYKDGFRAAFVLPLVLPAASVIMVFRVLFDHGGFINYVLDGLGLDTVNFFNSGRMFWIILFLYLWKNTGLAIILMLGGLLQIPAEYYEAARVDGASAFLRLRKITLPLMAPTFIFVAILSIVGAFKSFREAFALGGSHPHDSIYMIQHFMQNNFERLNFPRLSVAAVLTFIVIFACVLVMFAWPEEREGE
ncbi:MAG: sugar ABC transporter permease [Defluviitaleaceae bacterium]|nr:sugar ABC transporter permease [Defluviitaleaceae bacterium]